MTRRDDAINNRKHCGRATFPFMVKSRALLAERGPREIRRSGRAKIALRRCQPDCYYCRKYNNAKDKRTARSWSCARRLYLETFRIQTERLT